MIVSERKSHFDDINKYEFYLTEAECHMYKCNEGRVTFDEYSST